MRLSPTEKDPVKLADWAELQSLYSIDSQISLEAVRSQIDIDGSLFEEPIEPDESESLLHELSEIMVADAVAEIQRRANILKGAYPFKLSSGVLKSFRDYKYTPYTFCLLTADREYYVPGDQRTTILFEHLVCEALKAYIGGQSVRFGVPRDTLPKRIYNALDRLSNLTRNRKLDKGYPINTTDQDLGLDAVAWKNFPDKYWGKLEIYMQCATGQDWESKRCDFSLPKWRTILYWPFDPVPGLAIPYVVSKHEWERACTGVLLMDRLRIASVLKGYSFQKCKQNWQNWRDWCEYRIEQGRQQI